MRQKANVNWEELTDYWIRRYCETLEKNNKLKTRIEELEAQLDEADDNICDAEYYRTMYANQCQEMDVLKESIKVRNEVIDDLQSTIRNLEAENKQVRELERSRDTWYKTCMDYCEANKALKKKLEEIRKIVG